MPSDPEPNPKHRAVDPMADGAPCRPLGREAVKQSLKADPGLLIEALAEEPTLLDRLIEDMPRERPDGIVDLSTFMLRRLRGERDRLHHQRQAIIAASRANEHTLQRVQTAILFILDAQSFEQLIEVVTNDLALLLDLDAAALVIEADGESSGRPSVSGVRLVPRGWVDRATGGADIRLLPDRSGEEVIYGPSAGIVRSQALVRLTISDSTEPALLALGSRDPEMFQDGMRTDLVRFMGKVLERRIRDWLDL